jgi:serine/threonine protein kinase
MVDGSSRFGLAELKAPVSVGSAFCPSLSATVGLKSVARTRFSLVIRSSRCLFYNRNDFPVALDPGTRLGPYEVIAQIGAGGMGEVYKARDTRLDRTVAIKILPESLAADAEFRRRFDREARTISQLDHPYICAVYDVGEQNGISFLVMSYLDGESLERRLKRGALPVDQALRYAIQIADALEKAHRAGIVHRDLKPGNIMLTTRGAKLLDFGLAKTGAGVGATAGVSILPTTSPNLTAQGTLLGTVQYMAPEQLEGQEADAQTDIFAFGAVLYEMLTGNRAFEGQSQASLIGAILKDDPPPLTTALPTASPILDRIVRTCLAKNPDDRCQNAGDLGRELRWVTELGPSPASSAVEHRPGRERAAWGLASVFGLIALLLLPPAIHDYRTTRPDSLRVVFDLATPRTDDPISFVLSPDGQQLAFVAQGESNVDRLWVRPLGDDTARPLPGTEGASYPFWAPNGREIGFFADHKLKRIDVTGGSTDVIADAPSGRGGAWNQDDVIVFAPQTLGGLFRVHARGGPVAEVTHKVAGQYVGPRWPQFLPDGRHFVFFLGLAPAETRGMYLASLDGGEPRLVLPSESAAAYLPPGYLVLVRQELLVAVPFDGSRGTVRGEATRLAGGIGSDNSLARGAFSVAINGSLAYRAGGASAQRRQLVWVDRAGRVLGTVAPPDDVGAQGNPELSRDERRVALQSSPQKNNLDVWLVDVARGVSSRFTSDHPPNAARCGRQTGGASSLPRIITACTTCLRNQTARRLRSRSSSMRPRSCRCRGLETGITSCIERRGRTDTRNCGLSPWWASKSGFPSCEPTSTRTKARSLRIATGSPTDPPSQDDTKFTSTRSQAAAIGYASPRTAGLKCVGLPMVGSSITSRLTAISWR